MAAWTANNQRKREIENVFSKMPAIEYPVTSVNGRTGDVVVLGSDPREDGEKEPELDAVPINEDLLGGKTWEHLKEMDVIKKRYPVLDENGQPSAYPTFASQVFFDDGSVLEGKNFSVDPLTIYPVGSVYTSTNETSPAELFGGSWEQLKDRFLLGAGESYNAGDTGGESDVVITESQMPMHRHYENLPLNGVEARPIGVSTGDASYTETSASTSGGNKYYTTSFGYASASASKPVYRVVTGYQGEGQAHNNLPPYLAVYMWKRVA